MRKYLVSLPIKFDIPCPDWGPHYPHLYNQGRYVCPGGGLTGRSDCYALVGRACSYLIVDDSSNAEARAEQARAQGASIEEVAGDYQLIIIEGHRMPCGNMVPHLPHKTSRTDYCPGRSGNDLLVGEVIYAAPLGLRRSKFAVISRNDDV